MFQAADSTYVLPVLAGASFLAIIELGAEMPNVEQQKFMKRIFRFMTIPILFVSATMPQGLFAYWLVSNGFSLAQVRCCYRCLLLCVLFVCLFVAAAAAAAAAVVVVVVVVDSVAIPPHSHSFTHTHTHSLTHSLISHSLSLSHTQVGLLKIPGLKETLGIPEVPEHIRRAAQNKPFDNPFKKAADEVKKGYAEQKKREAMTANVVDAEIVSEASSAGAVSSEIGDGPALFTSNPRRKRKSVPHTGGAGGKKSAKTSKGKKKKK
jgi:hypothetical protein